MSRHGGCLATQGGTLTYEDLTLCEEKMRGLRAQTSPFTSLKNWSRRLQVLEVEGIDDASV